MSEGGSAWPFWPFAKVSKDLITSFAGQGGDSSVLDIIAIPGSAVWSNSGLAPRMSLAVTANANYLQVGHELEVQRLDECFCGSCLVDLPFVGSR